MDANLIKRKLLVKYPFFGSVIANTKWKEELAVDTAGTDGEFIYYNPTFLDNHTIEEQVFIFAHEICHIAFNHILRSKDKEHELWNIATDSVVNALLKSDGLPIIEGAVDIQEAINYDAETMYNKLLEEQKNQEQENNSSSGNNSSNGNGSSGSSNNSSGEGNNENTNDSSNKNESDTKDDSNDQSNENSENNNSPSSDNDDKTNESNKDVGHDTHSMWAKAVEKNEEQEKNNEKQNSDEKKEEQKISEQASFEQNRNERKKQLEDLRKSLASRSHGFSTGGDSDTIIRNVGEIGVAKPLIDWRYALKESIRYDIDWSYRNATFEDGILTPHLEKQPKSETEIVLDTSASIDEDLLRNFLRECKNIINTSKVKVGCFDTKFYGFTEIKSVNDIDKLEFRGGGNTDFNAAVNAFSRRVENKIIFTDGGATVPKMSLDAIWIVFGPKRINPPGGKVIYIDDEGLKKLTNLEIEPKKKTL